MILKGPIAIRFGGLTITEATLQSDRIQWRGKAVSPGMAFNRDLPVEVVLQALFFEMTPIILTAAEDGDLVVLDVELARFPYTIHSARNGQVYNSQPNFACFALRLVPISGKIVAVELDRTCTVGVNEFSFNPYLRLLAEFGNGTLRFEMYFAPVTETLEPLTAPKGYEPEVTLNDEDSPD